MHKEAVDQKSKEYWSAYFKEYGQMWVRDMPRRIKQAARRHIAATELEGSVAPLAKHVAEDGSLSLEAAFVGQIDGEDTRGLILAEFTHDGTLKSFDFTRV